MILDFLIGGFLSLLSGILSLLDVSDLPSFDGNFDAIWSGVAFTSAMPFGGDVLTVIVFVLSVIGAYYALWSLFFVYNKIRGSG